MRFRRVAAPRFLVHDRDAKYGTEVPAAIRSWKINAVRTSFESPWQTETERRELNNKIQRMKEAVKDALRPVADKIAQRIVSAVRTDLDIEVGPHDSASYFQK